MEKTNKSYTMRQTMGVAKQASKEITDYLQSLPHTAGVMNVEDDKEYQKTDIDLIWLLSTGQHVTIEIKADRYYHTGNYFFETISNLQKNTPGCFMYSKAMFLYYYFIEMRELHILPFKETRDWFLENIFSFQERRTGTRFGNGGYTTVGRLVPRDRLLANVEGAVVKRI